MIDKDSFARRRTQRKEKSAFPRTLFTRVGAIVQKYQLGADFLGRLKDCQGPPPLVGDVPRDKNIDPAGLFTLVSQAQYALTQEIIRLADNPYLAYAHCPEEIWWSKILYAVNPEISPERLLQRHFLEIWREEMSAVPDVSPQ